jgi:uncharacterized protein (DUF58 family)
LNNSGFRFLNLEDIRHLSNFEFAPKAVAEGYITGKHRSRAQGSSIEFRDYRQYVPGDDLALIDWRVYGRTDRFYLKTYEQETNLECHIFLDSSNSMSFGDKLTKLEYSSFFAAALSYLVIRKNDRVSLQIVDEGIRHYYPPGSTRGHLRKLLIALEKNYAGNRTSISKALKRSYPLLKKRAGLVVISDFNDSPAEIFSALGPYLHRGFQIHLFHVLSPDELNLKEKGLVTFEDLETGQRSIGHTDDICQSYKTAIDKHINVLRTMAFRRNINYTLATTETHYFHLFDRLTK